MTIKEIEQSIAACGLVCALCDADPECPGCKGKDDCEVKICCAKKGIDDCTGCGAYPCALKIHKSVRMRAFHKVAKEEGAHKLAEYLYHNRARGIRYHRLGLTGDYDRLETVEEVIALLKDGKPDPYVKCPIYESQSFLLRLVSMEDAPDLLKCYRNPDARMFFNADNCTSDFCYSTLEEMRGCIEYWLTEYTTQTYVRFGIVDKKIGKVVGTVEIFGGSHGVLRIDILPEYENEEKLSEIINIADSFFNDFRCEKIVTKAIPEAVNRITALARNGYHPYPPHEGWTREYYYMKRSPD